MDDKNIITKLLKPFTPSNLPVSFTGVELRKVDSYDLDLIARDELLGKLTRKQGMEMVFMLVFFIRLIEKCAIKFYDNEDKSYGAMRYVQQMHAGNIIYLGKILLSHTRGHEFIVARYTCGHCEASNPFDIDPNMEYSDADLEKSHLMQNTGNFFEVVQGNAQPTFTYNFRKPTEFTYKELVEGMPVDTKLIATSYTSSYPVIENYITVLSDPVKLQAVETYVALECLLTINDIPVDKFVGIKKQLGVNLFRLRYEEFEEYNRILSSSFGASIKLIDFKCISCGRTNIQFPDLTNFFGFSRQR